MMSESDDNDDHNRGPVFQSAKAMVPMEQLQELHEQLKCGNFNRGCRIPKRGVKLAWCHFCRMLKSKGSEFFDAERLITGAELAQATDWQKQEHAQLWEKWDKWTKDYPLV